MPRFLAHTPGFQLIIPAALILLLTSCGSTSGSGPRRSNPAPSPTPAITAARIASPIPGTYVALGASETYGVGATPFSRGYAHLVAHALRARHFQDLGIPGATLSSAYDVELTEALAARPELSTLFFGVNDLYAHIPRDAFLADLHDLALTLRRAGSRVLIIGLPSLTLIPAVRAAFPRLAGTTEAWNKGMAAVARQTGSRFLDLSRFSAELASHPEYIAADGLHPSNAGHRRLAEVVLAAIHSDKLWT